MPAAVSSPRNARGVKRYREHLIEIIEGRAAEARNFAFERDVYADWLRAGVSVKHVELMMYAEGGVQ